MPGNVAQGGGLDQYGQISGFMNFEIGAQGQGAKYVLDGLDYGAAVFNPEGDMGDIEMWELVKPMIYLGRRIKPNTGGWGRHRGGSSFETLLLVNGTQDFEIENIGAGGMLTSPGLFGGYPAPSAYVHNVFGSDIFEQAAAGKAYPVGDVGAEEPALNAFAGEHQLEQDPYTMMIAVKTGDLYLSTGRGGGGLGDPLLRPRGADRGGHRRRPPAAPTGPSAPTACENREGLMHARLERARPAEEWWAEQRQRILDQDLIETVKVMYAESMRLEPRWAAEFRGFWDLPEDFDFDVVTPTVTVQQAEPGKLTPAGLGARVPRRLGGLPARGPGRGPGHLPGDPGDRSPTCSTRSSAAARSRTSSPGSRTPTASTSGSSCCRSGSTTTTRSSSPTAKGMNIVRRASDGELVIRTDAGADLCRWDENWKMHAPMFVRDTRRALPRDLPRARPPRGRLAGAARVLLPALRPPAGDRSGTTRLPGHARVPARHRGLLQRLAGTRPSGLSRPATFIWR